MNEDKELKRLYGNKNPFKVPDGYFDHLADDIMAQLPDTPAESPAPISLWGKMKPWIYMAAMFVGMSFTIRMFMGKFGMEKEQTPQTATASYSVTDLPEEYVEPIVSQTMMDDYQLYEYLSDATNY